MRMFKSFCCWIGWHSYFVGFAGSDEVDETGVLKFARCKWCNYKGQIDSQGDLF